MDLNSDEKLIFVSCGQLTDEEKKLGQDVEYVINEKEGFRPYRAEVIQDLRGLEQHIFEALSRCSGAVVILHSRGQVKQSVGKQTVTSSMWVNQEVAILAFRHWLEAENIPVRMFKQPEVTLEGVMTSIIGNPTDFDSSQEVIDEVGRWLSGETFTGLKSEREFERLIAGLDDSDWKVIEAIFAGGEYRVSRQQLKSYLKQEMRLSSQDASRFTDAAINKFTAGNNLVEF